MQYTKNSTLCICDNCKRATSLRTKKVYYIQWIDDVIDKDHFSIVCEDCLYKYKGVLIGSPNSPNSSLIVKDAFGMVWLIEDGFFT